MLRNLALSWMLAVTLVTGLVPALPVIPAGRVMSTSVATTQVELAARHAAPAQASAPATAVQLSRAEMGAVQGAGFFSWISNAFKTIGRWLRVAGIIVAFVNLVFSWFESKPSEVEGGDRLDRNDSETVDYASQSDYDNGVVSSTATTEGTWQQSQVWYGGGDGGCGGGGDSGGLYNNQELRADIVC
jgi:hypothetical protein